MIVSRLYLCSEHVYAGHFGRSAGQARMVEVGRARLISGRGMEGDRYNDRPAGHKGQVTFFAEETWLRLRAELDRPQTGPEVFRRNIIVRGGNLTSLVGAEFQVQGIRFRGTEYCKPCFWMDQAFAPGTLERLSLWGAGGLRAAVESDGWLEAERESRDQPVLSVEVGELQR